jgi:peptide/nickel transport system ATP-binding protein
MSALLDVENLSIRFPIKRGWGKTSWLYAVDDVSFQVNRGETLSIVGESGSGKTTAALGVARLVPNSGGKVDLAGEDFLALEAEDLRKARAKVQVIFKEP